MIMGRSGAGKTELALTLVERALLRGEVASLVADDRTLLHVESSRLIASVPAALAGGVEIRGAGLFKVAFAEAVPLYLVVRLVDRDEAERYPSGEMWEFEGISLPRLLCRLCRRMAIPTRFRGPSKPPCSMKNGPPPRAETGFVTNRLIFHSAAAFCF